LLYVLLDKVVRNATATISSKYQVVIPREIRNIWVKPGQKVLFIPYKKSLRVVIIPPIEKLHGFRKGLIPTLSGEDEERVNVVDHPAGWNICQSGQQQFFAQ
jgi:bifunctional DNA-binding transcriptional regulator/antitoxin component of YhaV-PrlF toxin-antitoxin module